jgi:hypothetical protein
LHRRVVPERQHAERRCKRHDAQLEVRAHLGTVHVHVVAVDRRHRLFKVTKAKAAIEIVAKPDQPLAAEGKSIEVLYAEREKLLVLHQHIVADATRDVAARVGGCRNKTAHIKVYRLLG